MTQSHRCWFITNTWKPDHCLNMTLGTDMKLTLSSLSAKSCDGEFCLISRLKSFEARTIWIQIGGAYQWNSTVEKRSKKESAVPPERPCLLQSWPPAWPTETHDTLHWKSPASGRSAQPAHAGMWQCDPHHRLWLAESEKQHCCRIYCNPLSSIPCKLNSKTYTLPSVFDTLKYQVKYMLTNIQCLFVFVV